MSAPHGFWLLRIPGDIQLSQESRRVLLLKAFVEKSCWIKT